MRRILAIRRFLLVAICLTLPLGAANVQAQTGEKGVALKADKILVEPFADAKQAGTLAKGEAVTILKKTGGWYQVKGKGAKGWVRMLSVRRGEAAKGSAAKDVAAISTGRTGTGQIVSTTGVRGLSAEELKAAKYDEKELLKAEGYAVSKATAAGFAQKGKLAVRTVNYLPAK